MEGDEEKKPQGMSWLVKGGIILFAIIAVTMVGATLNARQKNSQSTTIPSTPTTPIVTLATLDDRVTSMQASLDSLSGRVANLDTRVTDLGTPNVTQADITGLRGSLGNLTVRIDGVAFSLASLNATVANISQGNSTNSTNLSDIEDNISDIKDALSAMDTRLDAIEANISGGGTNGAGITTWSPLVDVAADRSVTIAMDSGAIIIDKADMYMLQMAITNPNNVTATNATITLKLNPEAGDLPAVSSNTIFIGVDEPSLWNTTLCGGTQSCSRIDGRSSAFSVPVSSTPIPIWVRFKLVYGD